MLAAHFTRFFDANPGWLHFGAHSHHPWPDATQAAHELYWRDSATRVDRKWEKVFGEVAAAKAPPSSEIAYGAVPPENVAVIEPDNVRQVRSAGVRLSTRVGGSVMVCDFDSWHPCASFTVTECATGVRPGRRSMPGASECICGR